MQMNNYNYGRGFNEQSFMKCTFGANCTAIKFNSPASRFTFSRDVPLRVHFAFEKYARYVMREFSTRFLYSQRTLPCKLDKPPGSPISSARWHLRDFTSSHFFIIPPALPHVSSVIYARHHSRTATVDLSHRAIKIFPS